MLDYLIWVFVAILGVYLPYRYGKKLKMEDHEVRKQKEEASFLGMNQPLTQFPHINLDLCIGCGSCVKACPEGDVLGIVAGKATLVNGIKCVGHGKCAEHCPMGAITIGLGDLSKRTDIPIMSSEFETNLKHVYVAGELGGFALIRNAFEQGKKIIETISSELVSQAPHSEDPHASERYDVLIVGCGPAGLSSALSSIKKGLNYVVIDQQEMGGTVLQYPKRKLVLTEPVEIPYHGWLKKKEYRKETLLEIWQTVAKKKALNIKVPYKFSGLQHDAYGVTIMTTQLNNSESVSFYAKTVVLALGRRGTPRKLGVPGESKSKVMYALTDSTAFTDSKILVVGGGDSAIEAAMSLSEQSGNTVTLSYRKNKFFRIKRKNQERILEYSKNKKVGILFDSTITCIEDQSVVLNIQDKKKSIENDYVFIFAGGEAPFALLKEVGVGFNGE